MVSVREMSERGEVFADASVMRLREIPTCRGIAVGEISTCREVVVFVFRIAALPFTWNSKGFGEVVVDFVRLGRISSCGEVFADARVATSRDF